MSDTALWILVLGLAVLVGVGAATYIAVHPVAQKVAASIEAKASDVVDAVEHLQPMIEVRAPEVKWPPVLTWLFVAQTALIFILTASNVVDLLKLGKLYQRKRTRKQSDTHGTKKKNSMQAKHTKSR